MTQVIGWTLIHFVWQGSAIAIVAAAALRLLARRTADARYLAACVSLVALLAAPLATAAWLWPSASASDPAAAVNAGVPAPLADLARPLADLSRPLADLARPLTGGPSASVSGASGVLPRLLTGIVFAWLIGVGVLFGRMAGGWWIVRRLHRAALALPSSAWQPVCVRLASRLHLSRAIHVVDMANIDVPTVIGWMRPVVMLPIAALANLSPSQVEAILAHELAHVRRHDYVVNVMQTLAETLLFYHPATWWLSARIRAEREHCCDDAAVAVCGDAVGYARALTELERWRVESAPLALAATGGSLMHRVRRILRMPATDAPASPSWVVTLALVAIFTAGAGGVPQRVPILIAHAAAYSNVVVGPIAFSLPPAIAASQYIPPPPPPPPPARVAPPPPPPAPPAPEAAETSAQVPAPPAPPTPPAPPSPPAPPGGAHESYLSMQGDNSDWNMTWSNNGERMDARIHGDATFTDDLSDVQSLSPGGYLTVREWPGDVAHSVEIKWLDGRITRTYTVGGTERPWNDEARAFLAGEIAHLVRRSGYGARPRVKSILQRKGVGGVLEEVDKLEGDYVRRVYLDTLVASAPFDHTTILPVLQRIDAQMKSDYDRRVLLTAIAAKVPLDEKMAAAYLPVVASMRSDYDRREVLNAVLARRPLVPAVTQAALQAAGSMRSAYDKREVLTGMLNGGPTLGTGERRALLASVATMHSDYDTREVLVKYVRMFGVDEATRDPFFAAVEPMHSDYDRAEVLTALLAHQAVDAGLRPAVVAATDRMHSSYDQNRVLAALARAERR